MSGIYIQMAEMPKSCWVCELGGAVQMDNHTCPFYSMEYWEQENYQDKIADGCPIIPVPDHGRLIDADALCERLEKAAEIKPYLNGMNAAISFALLAPTIIPASGGDAE